MRPCSHWKALLKVGWEKPFNWVFVACSLGQFKYHIFYPKGSGIRKAIYTANAIESLKNVIMKSTKNIKFFLSGDSTKKMMYLVIQEASKKWTMPIRDWKSALNRFIFDAFVRKVPRELIAWDNDGNLKQVSIKSWKPLQKQSLVNGMVIDHEELHEIDDLDALVDWSIIFTVSHKVKRHGRL